MVTSGCVRLGVIFGCWCCVLLLFMCNWNCNVYETMGDVLDPFIVVFILDLWLVNYADFHPFICTKGQIYLLILSLFLFLFLFFTQASIRYFRDDESNKFFRSRQHECVENYTY